MREVWLTGFCAWSRGFDELETTDFSFVQKISVPMPVTTICFISKDLLKASKQVFPGPLALLLRRLW